jgi:hypothetical protein
MKTQAEALQEMEEFIKLFGIGYSQEKEMKLVAKMADSSDKAIRENAVSLLAEVYKHVESDIWRIIGEVTPKV